MRTVIILLLMLFIDTSLPLLAQNVSISSEFEIGDKEIYDKKTGELISKEDFINRIKENPRVSLEPVVNEFGSVSHFILDSENFSGRTIRDPNKRVKNGEDFPPFAMTTYEGESICLDSLRGTNVILYFQLMMELPIFNVDQFVKYDNMIQNLKKKTPLKSLMITTSKKEVITKFLDPNDIESKIIPDGKNWMDKYLIINLPSVVIIDDKGKLVGYYKSVDLGTIEKELSKL